MSYKGVSSQVEDPEIEIWHVFGAQESGKWLAFGATCVYNFLKVEIINIFEKCGDI